MPTPDEPVVLPPTPFHPATITAEAREVIDRLEQTLALPHDTVGERNEREAHLDALTEDALVVGVKLAVSLVESVVSIARSLAVLAGRE